MKNRKGIFYEWNNKHGDKPKIVIKKKAVITAASLLIVLGALAGSFLGLARLPWEASADPAPLKITLHDGEGNNRPKLEPGDPYEENSATPRQWLSRASLTYSDHLPNDVYLTVKAANIADWNDAANYYKMNVNYDDAAFKLSPDDDKFTPNSETLDGGKFIANVADMGDPDIDDDGYVEVEWGTPDGGTINPAGTEKLKLKGKDLFTLHFVLKPDAPAGNYDFRVDIVSATTVAFAPSFGPVTVYADDLPTDLGEQAEVIPEAEAITEPEEEIAPEDEAEAITEPEEEITSEGEAEAITEPEEETTSGGEAEALTGDGEEDGGAGGSMPVRPYALILPEPTPGPIETSDLVAPNSPGASAAIKVERNLYVKTPPKADPATYGMGLANTTDGRSITIGTDADMLADDATAAGEVVDSNGDPVIGSWKWRPVKNANGDGPGKLYPPVGWDGSEALYCAGPVEGSSKEYYYAFFTADSGTYSNDTKVVSKVTKNTISPRPVELTMPDKSFDYGDFIEAEDLENITLSKPTTGAWNTRVVGDDSFPARPLSLVSAGGYIKTQPDPADGGAEKQRVTGAVGGYPAGLTAAADSYNYDPDTGAIIGSNSGTQYPNYVFTVKPAKLTIIQAAPAIEGLTLELLDGSGEVIPDTEYGSLRVGATGLKVKVAGDPNYDNTVDADTPGTYSYTRTPAGLNINAGTGAINSINKAGIYTITVTRTSDGYNGGSGNYNGEIAGAITITVSEDIGLTIKAHETAQMNHGKYEVTPEPVSGENEWNVIVYGTNARAGLGGTPLAADSEYVGVQVSVDGAANLWPPAAANKWVVSYDGGGHWKALSGAFNAADHPYTGNQPASDMESVTFWLAPGDAGLKPIVLGKGFNAVDDTVSPYNQCVLNIKYVPYGYREVVEKSNDAGMGSITPSGALTTTKVAAAGTALNPKAVPEAGYDIDYYSFREPAGAGSGATNAVSAGKTRYTPADKAEGIALSVPEGGAAVPFVITAVFKSAGDPSTNFYDVNVAVDPAYTGGTAKITKIGGVTADLTLARDLEEGTEITVTATATPDEDKYFVGWYKGEERVSADKKFTFILGEDELADGDGVIFLKARFREAIDVPITVSKIKRAPGGRLNITQVRNKLKLVGTAPDGFDLGTVRETFDVSKVGNEAWGNSRNGSWTIPNQSKSLGEYNIVGSFTPETTPDGYKLIFRNGANKLKVEADPTYTVKAVANLGAGGSVVITQVDGDAQPPYTTAKTDLIVDAVVAVSATARTGYHFSGWYLGTDTNGTPVSVSAANVYEVSDDDTDDDGVITLTAKFEANRSVYVKANPSTGGTVEWAGVEDGLNKAPGATLTANATENPGYTFAGWSVTEPGGAGSTDIDTENLSYTYVVPEGTGDVTLIANFTKIPHFGQSRVKIQKAGGGGTAYIKTIGGAAQPMGTLEAWVDNGVNIRVSASPDAQSDFAGWSVKTAAPPKTSSASEWTYQVAESDAAAGQIVIEAKFVSKPVDDTRLLTLTASPAGAGTVSGGGSRARGAEAAFSAAANTGWICVGFYEAGEPLYVSREKNLSWHVALDNNRAIEARFEPYAEGSGGSGGSRSSSGSSSSTPTTGADTAISGQPKASAALPAQLLENLNAALKESGLPALTSVRTYIPALAGASEAAVSLEAHKAITFSLSGASVLEIPGSALLKAASAARNITIVNEPYTAALPPAFAKSAVSAPEQTFTIVTSVAANNALTSALAARDKANETISAKALTLAVLSGDKAAARYKQPIQIRAALPGKLSAAQLKNLTGILYNPKTGELKQLGGEVSSDGKTFTFYTYEPGVFTIAVSNKLAKLTLSPGNSLVVLGNGSPYVNIADAAKALGASVSYGEAEKTVTIKFGKKTFEAAAGRALPGNMGTPSITNGQVYVPLRYLSEVLGANVLWNEKTKTAEVYY
ncbi:MAG: hypothetical protein LBU36_02140 [Clostridiales bacterium]|jgi:hypothetical protein|nr:hypothetical protein [Clostridiales bacterium]